MAKAWLAALEGAMPFFTARVDACEDGRRQRPQQDPSPPEARAMTGFPARAIPASSTIQQQSTALGLRVGGDCLVLAVLEIGLDRPLEPALQNERQQYGDGHRSDDNPEWRERLH